MKQTRKNDPFETLFDALLTIMDYEFEGSDVSSDEYELAKSRFKSALCYIITTQIERSGNVSQ